MKEQLISLETAKLAKEKGFNLFSQGWYGTDNPAHGEPNKFHIRTYLTWDSIGEEDSQEGTEIYSAPTQSLLQKWLREKYKLHITIFSSSQESWMFRITNKHQKLEDGLYGEDYSTYEDAREDGLLESLNLIKL